MPTKEWTFPGTVAMAAFVTVMAGLLILAGAARADGVNNSTFIGGTAIEGHNPVAYFTEGKPVEGSSIYTYRWKGATWKFASQYGGYCAWMVSQGYTAGIDPEAWCVVDGKLYLNYSKSIQKRWVQDIPGNIAKGDANWPKIAAKLAE
ncbi:MAG: YHS domain-containing (seleno)protein [Rhodospirillales bacterium]|jgi:hypothetical protein|nr:YHS domain-containing (seleno)protein [Rhodospirillales bacterium]MDP7242515.1 YHS domain-containing (seleno)protein [Rhodospirillales bacterium]HJO73469.1 YHS domain-containing (seleno)protein [Rhodospirillales bacterium]